MFCLLFCSVYKSSLICICFSLFLQTSLMWRIKKIRSNIPARLLSISQECKPSFCCCSMKVVIFSATYVQFIFTESLDLRLNLQYFSPQPFPTIPYHSHISSPVFPLCTSLGVSAKLVYIFPWITAVAKGNELGFGLQLWWNQSNLDVSFCSSISLIGDKPQRSKRIQEAKLPHSFVSSRTSDQRKKSSFG